MPSRPTVTSAALIERYDVFFLDAYGVLVTTGGALPGAAALLEGIERAHKRFAILSNDASRLPSTIAQRYASFGLPIVEACVFTSGMLVADYFREHRLDGARTLVLGTKDSWEYVRRAGGDTVPIDAAHYDVLVVADDDGFPFLPGVEGVLTSLFSQIDRGHVPRLVLPNPDLIYPKGLGEYGLASGTIALAFEHALRLRYANHAPSFVRLGKPETRLYERAAAALAVSGKQRTVMLGDQLVTDVLGARRFGIDSVLLGTGLTRLDAVGRDVVDGPTWFMASVAD